LIGGLVVFLWAIATLFNAGRVPPTTMIPSSGPPGTAVGFVGQGFAPNSLVEISWALGGDPVLARADGSGNFQATTSVPLDAQPGPRNVIITDREKLTLTLSFLVVGDALTLPPTLLPPTLLPPTPPPLPSVPAPPGTVPPAGAEVIGAVCSFQTQMASATKTLESMGHAVENEQPLQLQELMSELEGQMGRLKPYLGIFGNWLPLAAIAGNYNGAIDEFLPAVRAWAENPNEATYSAAQDKARPFVDLGRQLENAQGEYQLGEPCWPRYNT